MTKEEIEAKCQEIIGNESEGFREVMDCLKQFALSLQHILGSHFMVRFEPVIVGQGIKFRLRVKSERVEDTLLTVFVPTDGFPVKFSYRPSANSLTELEDGLLEILEDQQLRLRSLIILGKP